MIDRKFIKEHLDEVKGATAAKGYAVDFDAYTKLLERLSAVQQESESIAAQKNAASAKIPKASAEERQEIIETMRQTDARHDALKTELEAIEREMQAIEAEIPNMPRPDVRVGRDAAENEVLREVGKKPEFAFTPKPAHELGELLDVIDTKRAANVSGSRFAFLKGQLAELQFALIQFTMAELIPKGFQMVVPPVMVRRTAMEAMGYLAAHGENETYVFEKDDLFLTGTSEQSIGPMHAGETLDAAVFPLRYLAYSTCFRRESGSYGKDTKGIIRVHQFDKLEMFVFTTPENSDEEHELLLACEESLMQKLGLAYRVIKMVTGDLGVPAARKYDIEAWMPAAGEYRETHSTSNCTDYQARRLNIRYRTGKESGYAHTLNGTAFAIGRILSVILEQCQTEAGELVVPEALRPYCRFERIASSR